MKTSSILPLLVVLQITGASTGCGRRAPLLGDKPAPVTSALVASAPVASSPNAPLVAIPAQIVSTLAESDRAIAAEKFSRLTRRAVTSIGQQYFYFLTLNQAGKAAKIAGTIAEQVDALLSGPEFNSLTESESSALKSNCKETVDEVLASAADRLSDFATVKAMIKSRQRAITSQAMTLNALASLADNADWALFITDLSQLGISLASTPTWPREATDLQKALEFDAKISSAEDRIAAFSSHADTHRE